MKKKDFLSHWVLVWSFPLVLYPAVVWEWFWQVWAQLHKLGCEGEGGLIPPVGCRGEGRGLTLSGCLLVCQSTLSLSLPSACINFSRLSESATLVDLQLLSGDWFSIILDPSMSSHNSLKTFLAKLKTTFAGQISPLSSNLLLSDADSTKVKFKGTCPSVCESHFLPQKVQWYIDWWWRWR